VFVWWFRPVPLLRRGLLYLTGTGRENGKGLEDLSTKPPVITECECIELPLAASPSCCTCVRVFEKRLRCVCVCVSSHMNKDRPAPWDLSQKETALIPNDGILQNTSFDYGAIPRVKEPQEPGKKNIRRDIIKINIRCQSYRCKLNAASRYGPGRLYSCTAPPVHPLPYPYPDPDPSPIAHQSPRIAHCSRSLTLRGHRALARRLYLTLAGPGSPWRILACRGGIQTESPLLAFCLGLPLVHHWSSTLCPVHSSCSPCWLISA
jgi:hypothetical protein